MAKPSGVRPGAGLVGADGGDGVRADHPVGRAGVVAAGDQPLLQLDLLGARELALAARPGAGDRAAAHDAVAEVADAHRVGGGVVVLLDDEEVVVDREGRAAGAGGGDDRGRAVVGERRAVHQRHAAGAPVGDRAEVRLVGAAVVEALRQAHLDAPGLAAGPAGAGEVVGGGGERVGRVVGPDVAAAVAGEVDGVGEVGGRA